MRVLTAEPIRVLDNFLPTPLSRADVLRPPAHFSAPLRRYTLQQMSICWGLYGGHDLPSSTAARHGKKVDGCGQATVTQRFVWRVVGLRPCLALVE